MTGTTPPGVTGEQAAAQWVRGMFGRIAGRYDVLNRVLSFNLDRRWRARLVARATAAISLPGARVLDLCCGTGDVLLAIEDRHKTTVFGSDFCHPMLTGAQIKLHRNRLKSVLLESDALQLPFAAHQRVQRTLGSGLCQVAAEFCK